jgi:O-antigen/teichoic acid export membrane protein
MSLVSTVANAAGSWSTTKLPQYGMLVAREDWLALKKLWRRSTGHSLLFAILGSFVMLATVCLASPYFPKLAERFAGTFIAVLLCTCMIAQNFINSCAYILRAFKQEPYMWPSVIGAVVNASFIWLFTSQWGIFGSAVGSTLCYLIMFYPTYYIFKIKQLEFLGGVNLMKRG